MILFIDMKIFNCENEDRDNQFEWAIAYVQWATHTHTFNYNKTINISIVLFYLERICHLVLTHSKTHNLMPARLRNTQNALPELLQFDLTPYCVHRCLSSWCHFHLVALSNHLFELFTLYAVCFVRGASLSCKEVWILFIFTPFYLWIFWILRIWYKFDILNISE